MSKRKLVIVQIYKVNSTWEKKKGLIWKIFVTEIP